MLVLVLLYLLQLFIDDVIERQAGALILPIDVPEMYDPGLFLDGPTGECNPVFGPDVMLEHQQLLAGASSGVASERLASLLELAPTSSRGATVYSGETFPEQGERAWLTRSGQRGTLLFPRPPSCPRRRAAQPVLLPTSPPGPVLAARSGRCVALPGFARP